MNIEKTKLNNLKETENDLITPNKGIIKIKDKLYGVKYYTDVSEVNGLIHNISVYPVVRQELEDIIQYLEPFDKTGYWSFGSICPMTMKILEDEIDYWFYDELFEWVVPIIPKIYSQIELDYLFDNSIKESK